jgi:DNA-binding Lrp family transcriptional regulator
MDAIDQRIISILRTDGRITNADLAEKVGLSPSACLRRVRLLEESGTIRGYSALIMIGPRHRKRSSLCRSL